MPHVVFGQPQADNAAPASYDFSMVPGGAFPSNSSAFAFSENDPSNTTTVEGATSPLGNGLLVSAYDLAEPGFLRIGVSSDYSGFTFNMSFFWNYTSNYGLTEDFISISAGSTMLFNISFGPEGGYFVRENGTNGKAVAGEPQINQLCNLSVTYNSTSGTYFQIENGSGTFFPVFYPSPMISSSSLTILVGGYVSTIFLRSMSLYAGNTVACAALSTVPVNYTGTILPNFPFGAARLSSIQYDRGLNTMLGIVGNGSIAGYNLVNATSFVLGRGEHNGTFTAISTCTPGYAWFLEENMTSTIVFSIGLDSLAANRTILPFGGYVPVSMIVAGSTIIAFNSNNTYTIIHTGTAGFSTTVLPLQSGARLVAAELGGQELNATWLSMKNLTRYSIDPNDGSNVLSQRQNISSLLGTVAILDSRSNDDAVASIIQYGMNSTIALFSEPKTLVAPIRTSNGMAGSVSPDSDAVISNGTDYYSLHSGTLSLVSGLPAAAGTFVDLGNGDFLSASGNTTILNLPSNQSVTTGREITVTAKSTYTITAPAIIATSINSTSAYLETLSFSNESLQTSNGSFFFNPALFGNGIYAAIIHVQNLQGYHASLSTEVIVDCGNPIISANFGNGSFIPQAFDLALNFTFWTGMNSIYLLVGAENFTLPARNSTEGLNFSSLDGPVELQLFLLDLEGVVHRYTYELTVVPYQHGPFEISIENGTYLNSTSVSLNWSKLEYASGYTVNITGTEFRNLSSARNYCNTTLGNGDYLVSIHCELMDNETVFVGDRSFHVQSFGPGISLTGNGSGYYSFFGNSWNDTFSMTAITNVSAQLDLQLLAPSGSVIYEATGTGSVGFDASSNLDLFASQGVYMIAVNATGKSGLRSFTSISLNVNNSIPSLPFQGSVIYTNQSEISLNPVAGRFCSYAVSLYMNSALVFEGENLRELILPNGVGSYNMSTSVYSAWGNHVAQNTSIVYETASPEIALNAYYNGSEFLSYAISDSAPVVGIVLSYLNETVSKTNPSSQDRLQLLLYRNAVFNISFAATDACGNVGYSNLTVDFQRLVNITGFSLTVYPIFGLGIAYIKLSGQNTQNASVQWLVNGKPYHGPTLLLPFLGFGEQNFTAVIGYGNHTTYVTRNAFFIGWYPIIAALGAFIAFEAYRRIGSSDEPGKIESFIRSMNGAPLKAIAKHARKQRMNEKAINEAIAGMKKAGEARIESDPDGRLYLFVKPKG